ncbi:MAG: YncE family protein [Deltaproteobacteria bacterium]|nr:YncE family protein [Deltaproteobacteria bacterium]
MHAPRLVVALTLVAVSACGIGSTGLGPSEPPSSAVVASIPIGDYGTDVALRPDGKRAYVTLRTNKVVAIDTASRTVAATITTGGQPGAIALTPDGARGYVMDMSAQSLFVLDTRSDALATRLPVSSMARPILAPSVAVAPDGRHAYVTNATSDDDHLLIVDAGTNRIVKDKFLPLHPAGVAASPDGTRVYVVGCKLACIDGALLTLDPTTADVTSTLALAAAPSGLALAPDGKRAYVANGRDASVAIVELPSGAVSSVAVSPQPLGIALHPNGRLLYVASVGTARIDVIDTLAGNVVGRIGVASMPRAIAISPDGRFAYVTHSLSSLSVIDLSRAAES